MPPRVLVMDPLEVTGRVQADVVTQQVVDAVVTQAALSAVEVPPDLPPEADAEPSDQPDPARMSLGGRGAVKDMSDDELFDAIERTYEAFLSSEREGFAESLKRNLGILFSERVGRALQRVLTGEPSDDDVIGALGDSGLALSDLDSQAQEDLRFLFTKEGGAFQRTGRDEDFERLRQSALSDLYVVRGLLEKLRDLSPFGPVLEGAEKTLSSHPDPTEEEILDWLDIERPSAGLRGRRPGQTKQPSQPVAPAPRPAGSPWRPYRPTPIRPSRDVRTRSGATITDPGFEGKRWYDDPHWGYSGANTQYEVNDRNLKRMLNGQPPLDRSGASVQLHHRAQHPRGPLDEYSVKTHRGVPHPERSSDIDRHLFEQQKHRHWVSRARSLLGYPDYP